MSTIPTLTDRLEAATLKAENGSAIMHAVANGDATTEVQTESGPVPSINKWLADLNDRTSGALGQVEAGLEAEVLARQQADQALNQALTDEAQARAQADQALNQTVSAEVQARQQADQALEQAIGVATQTNTHAAAAKTTPVDADEFPLVDSASTPAWGLKKLTWANLKTVLRGLFVPKYGAVMTGNLTVPSLNGGQLAGMRNKIINGKMEIAQRGTSFAAASGYSLDRWNINKNAGVVAVTQNSDVPSSNEFRSSLRVEVTTADTSIAAGDIFKIDQRVEGYNARDLLGRPFTLSFWVRSSKTGIHCISFANNTDRSYVAEYTINTANTWEYKTITVSGGLPVSGTWNWTNSVGVIVSFVLAAGTTYQTAKGAWQAGSYFGTANQVNCLDTVGNIFALTGVQLEVGEVATPFEHRPYGVELSLCQRYYYRMTNTTSSNLRVASGYNNTASTAQAILVFPVSMRADPISLEQSGVAGNYVVAHADVTTPCTSVPVIGMATPQMAMVVFTVSSGLTAGQGSMVAIGASTNAYLGFSSEL